MKVCLPTRDGMIDAHFGHCEYFTVFTIENGQITEEEIVGSPEGCGCKSGIAPILAEKGVTLLLGGNMGEGAKNVLNYNGIDVIRGCSGPVRLVAEAWIRQELEDSQISCDHHNCGNH